MPRDPELSRRRLFKAAAAAGGGVVASALLAEQPAQAANGQAVKLGDANTATATTAISTNAGSGLAGNTTSDGDCGLAGYDKSPDGGYGTYGNSIHGWGVVGETTGTARSGVYGQDNSFSSVSTGVTGISAAGSGVYGQSTTADGVFGSSVSGPGIAGSSDYGDGVQGFANADGQAGVHGFDNSPDGGYAVVGEATLGTAVLAKITNPANASAALQASTAGTGYALDVAGKLHFDRSGTAIVNAGHTSRKVTVAGVTRSSMVLATIQVDAGPITIANVVPGNGSFTINLTDTPTGNVRVAWLVLD